MSSGSYTAGLPHNLTCSATVVHGLASAPSLQWEGPGVGQPGVEVSGESMFGPLTLSFSSLFTAHGGVYTCTATLSVPSATIRGTNTTIVAVQSMYGSPVCNTKVCNIIMGVYDFSSSTP
jgi:hypothetical protein